MSRISPLFLLVAGCDFFPEFVDSGVADVDPNACDPQVLVPAVLIAGDDSIPADAHADTYGSAPAPVHIRYQWPDKDPSNSAAFLWATDVDTLASIVEIGPADTFPDGADRVEGYSFLFGTGEVGAGDHRTHEVRLCGTLEPNTTYSYRVGGEDSWSKTFTFTTPGKPGTFDTFRVAIAGDSRGAYATWETIINKMDAFEPDFIMFSGDMVELGPNQHEWDAWFDASGEILARTPVLAAHGNHEFLAQNYFAQFAFPNNEQWYSVRYGDLLLLSLNDTVQAENDRDSSWSRKVTWETSRSFSAWTVSFRLSSSRSP
ncbi:MAG: FN3 domain-containing metallophosphoesterase family protein [Myxococcota bacterium]